MEKISQCDNYWREKINKKRKLLWHPTDPDILYNEENWLERLAENEPEI